MEKKLLAIENARIALVRVALLFFASLLWLVAWRYYPHIAVEHGPMENFQAACILAGMFVLAWTAWRTPDAAGRILYAGVILLYLTFLLVEFDTRPLQNKWLTILFNGVVRNTALVILWVAGFFWFLRHVRAVFEFFARWIRAPAGITLVISGGYWLLAGAIDKVHPFTTGNANLMAEEFLEVNAAFLMLLVAIDCRERRPTSESAAGLAETLQKNSEKVR
ncbi:MAG: hypothetical protein L0Y58_17205 [Verrucomicrobia subdivision 3 bacterium]|nr:hypothetical protein [Limisphaerales bacterium]